MRIRKGNKNENAKEVKYLLSTGQESQRKVLS